MGPGTLDQGGFIDLLGGSVITADDGAFTCTAGKGSLIDFAIVRKDIAGSVSLAQDLEAPCSPQVGLTASVQVGAWKDMIWKWAHPRHLPRGRPLGPHNNAQAPEAPSQGSEGKEPSSRWGQRGGFWNQEKVGRGG